ncbi:hypothetical protein SAMN05421732_10335 [Acinetobacter kookii]|uniref:Uncharacterized protein n=1 Tax=Acinetobacter kookii TaxID=1226327 RepID=A0A1G6IHU5_9GAMM|nr:hypothetical protein SAMN05421732_10335 [Acinetobacter kookii]
MPLVTLGETKVTNELKQFDLKRQDSAVNYLKIKKSISKLLN